MEKVIQYIIRWNVPISWILIWHSDNFITITGASREILLQEIYSVEKYSLFDKIYAELYRIYEHPDNTFSKLSEEKQAYIRLKYL